mmetsp:Transcript_17252/g.52165  ORF Transcript_17252/g.52165 Transcript_17252/m.52165 type:complete len:97 (-) Transcript_17252:37-327(-)
MLVLLEHAPPRPERSEALGMGSHITDWILLLHRAILGLSRFPLRREGPRLLVRNRHEPDLAEKQTRESDAKGSDGDLRRLGLDDAERSKACRRHLY